MIFKYILSVLSFIGVLFLLCTCKTQDVKPCAGAKEPTPAFTMMEMDPVYYFGYTTYDTDTAGPGWVQFTALEPNAKYEWKIGTDTTVFTKQQFSLDFANYWAQNQPHVPPVAVTLKVTTSPGSCFPASDSVKYMTRTLYIIDTLLLNGTFKGHFNFDPTLKTVHINVDTTLGRSQAFFISNLPGYDSVFIPAIDIGGGYRKAVFDFSSYYFGYDNHIEKGEIMVTPDNKNIFIWMKQNDPKLPPTYTFTGTRIK